MTRYLLEAFGSRNCSCERPREGTPYTIVPTTRIRGNVSFPPVLPSRLRTWETSKTERDSYSRQSPDDDTRGAGRPAHPTSPHHAPGDACEEILESPSICNSIHAVSDVAQKSGTSDSALRMCSRSSDIHPLAGPRWWLRTNSLRDAAGGDSDGAGSGKL